MHTLGFQDARLEPGTDESDVLFKAYMIDGRPLADLLSEASGWKHSGCTAFAADFTVEYQKAAYARLLGSLPGDLPSGRVALLVCSACGDLGCGAVGVRVRVGAATVSWSSFAHENNYCPEHTALIDGVGPFEFAREAYEAALDSLRRWPPGSEPRAL